MTLKIIEEKGSNGAVKKYQVSRDGTWYHIDTAFAVITALEKLRKSRKTARVFYGSRSDGLSWLDEYDTVGRIGRSTGGIKIPLIVPEGDIGGPALLDHCILRIDVMEDNGESKTVYSAKNFKVGEISMTKFPDTEAYPYRVFRDGEYAASFETNDQAIAYMAFIKGILFYPIYLKEVEDEDG